MQALLCIFNAHSAVMKNRLRMTMQYVQWIKLGFLLKFDWNCIFRLELWQDYKTNPGLCSTLFIGIFYPIWPNFIINCGKMTKATQEMSPQPLLSSMFNIVNPCYPILSNSIWFYPILSTFMIRLELWQDDKSHSGEEPSATAAAVPFHSLDPNLPPPPVIFCRPISPWGIFLRYFSFLLNHIVVTVEANGLYFGKSLELIQEWFPPHYS